MGFRLNPSSLLVLPFFLLLVSLMFFSCSHGVSGSKHLDNSHASGFNDEGKFDKSSQQNIGGPTTTAIDEPTSKGSSGPTAKTVVTLPELRGIIPLPEDEEKGRLLTSFPEWTIHPKISSGPTERTGGPTTKTGVTMPELRGIVPLPEDEQNGRLLTSFPQRTIYNQVNQRRLESSDQGNSSYLILAAERTRRKDPSDHFNYYTGGWNITNSHYLFSVAYSASPPVIVAIAWFFLFGLWLFCVCCCCCCCPRKGRGGYSRTIFALSLCTLVLLTITAAAGTAVLYTGETKFQNSVENVLDYVLKEADRVVTNLQNLLNSLMDAKKIGDGELSLPEDYQKEIDQMGTTINDVADNFQNISSKSLSDIHKFLDSASKWLTYVAAALIILAILGFLFSLLGLQCIIYILMIIGWILVAATFIMSGLFLVIHNTVTDTCVAVDDYLQNPDASSALEKILPKVDYNTAQQISDTTKDATFGIISTINNVITNVSNADIPPEAGPPLFYNQSGPLVPLLCNPYQTNRDDRQCAKDEVDFKAASTVWKKYVCQVSKSGICTTQGRITPDRYTQMTASVNVSYGLYKETPFLVDLIDSTFVKETFTNISKKHCPDLSKYSEMTYIGFLVSSSAVMLSIVLWIVYARQRKRRSDSKKSLNMMTFPMGGRFDRDMA